MTLCFADKEIRRNRAEAMSTRKNMRCCSEEQNKQTNNITNALGNATSIFSHDHSFLHH